MDLQNTVIDVVTTLLEETAFIFSDLSKATDISDERKKKMTGFCINYSNHGSGRVSVYAEKPITLIMAANMLGLEEGDSEAVKESENALKEFTNILAGNMITAVYGTAPIFDLSLPEKAPDIMSLASGDRSIMVWVEAEGSAILAHFDETGK